MAKEFLSGLIDRAYDRAPVLQKRRRSRFEPEDRFRGQWIESENEMPVSRAAIPPMHFTRPVAEPGDAPSAIIKENAVEHRQAEPRTLSNERIHEPLHRSNITETKADVSRTVPEGRIVERVIERVPGDRITERHTHSHERTMMELRETRVERVRTPERTDRSPRESVAPVSEQRLISTPEQHRSQSVAVPPTRSELRPSQPKAVQAYPVRPTPIVKPLTVPPVPAPDSTIHVTIGRIELRAPHPAPTRPAGTRPRAPQLRLEDYLQQRNGGSR